MAAIEAFVKGQLTTPEAEVAVVHAAVGAMKEIKPRADFEVYLKKFLQSLNLILANAAGHSYLGSARRFGYLLRMVNVEESDISSIRRSHPRNHLDLEAALEQFREIASALNSKDSGQEESLSENLGWMRHSV